MNTSATSGLSRFLCPGLGGFCYHKSIFCPLTIRDLVFGGERCPHRHNLCLERHSWPSGIHCREGASPSLCFSRSSCSPSSGPPSSQVPSFWWSLFSLSCSG